MMPEIPTMKRKKGTIATRVLNEIAPARKKI